MVAIRVLERRQLDNEKCRLLFGGHSNVGVFDYLFIGIGVVKEEMDGTQVTRGLYDGLAGSLDDVDIDVPIGLPGGIATKILPCTVALISICRWMS